MSRFMHNSEFGADAGSTDKLFYDMLKRGLVCTSHSWIERAVAQKNHKMTVGLAHSIQLIYDDLDKVLMKQVKLN